MRAKGFKMFGNNKEDLMTTISVSKGTLELLVALSQQTKRKLSFKEIEGKISWAIKLVQERQPMKVRTAIYSLEAARLVTTSGTMVKLTDFGYQTAQEKKVEVAVIRELSSSTTGRTFQEIVSAVWQEAKALFRKDNVNRAMKKLEVFLQRLIDRGLVKKNYDSSSYMITTQGFVLTRQMSSI